MFPSDETIAGELYPLERTLRIYTTQRSLDRQEVESFLRFYLEGSGDLADEQQLIPICEAVLRRELDRLTDPSAYDEPIDETTSTTTTTTSTTSTTTEVAP